jgi:putative ABC transport system substrate-binding protein
LITRRKLVIALGASALTTPFGSFAQQQGKVWRIGILWDSPAAFSGVIEAFRQGLRDLGYVEGRTIVIEYRWTEGKPERMRELAEELVRLRVDVIVAPTSVYTAAAKRATATIPIIFLVHADPVGSGHVASLARPGGNITGLTIMRTEINVKLLELLKETVPGLSRVAVIFHPATPSHEVGLKAIEVAAPALGLQIQPVAVRSATEFDAAFSAIVREHAGAVLMLGTPVFLAGAKRLAELALMHKLPSLFGVRQQVEAGGLMSFGPDFADQWRRGAIYVDKILKGATPADLPVQQPTKFELVINMKTAKALGIKIPNSILLRADKLIE